MTQSWIFLPQSTLDNLEHVQVPTSTENSKSVELLFKKPYGILPLLDDECKFPKASDDSYFQRCNLNHLDKSCYGKVQLRSKSRKYESLGQKQGKSRILHQALRRVDWYSIHDFLRKNRRSITNEGIRALAESYNPVRIKRIKCRVSRYQIPERSYGVRYVLVISLSSSP